MTDMAFCPSCGFQLRLMGSTSFSLSPTLYVFPSLAQFSARAPCYILIGSCVFLFLLLLAVLSLCCSRGPSSVEARGLSSPLACAILVPQPGSEPVLFWKADSSFLFFFWKADS